VSRKVLFSAVLLLAAGSPGAFAQTTGAHPLIFVDGGGWNSIRNLDTGTVSNRNDWGTGYNVGGGLGIQVGNGLALRGVYTFARSEGRTGLSTALAPISGERFDRHYYGGDLQFRLPVSWGFAPYVFGGGGAVTVDPRSSQLFSSSGTAFASERFTRPAARFGLGFEYQVPNSGFGILAQGDGWLYRWNRFGLNRNQLDTTWGLGLSYKFGY